MATVKAFKALRYNTQKVSIAKVTAPPYDVINAEGQEYFYSQDESNVIRLILGKNFADDNDSNNRYSRAKNYLASWRRDNVLLQEETPSLYLYEQEFRPPHDAQAPKRVRQSLFALLRLEEFDQGGVLPHEKTFSKPKADRMKVLTETQTILSPMMGLYEDKNKEVYQLLNQTAKKELLFEFEDWDKETQRLWKLSGPDLEKCLNELLKSKKILIADGHHRYETALEYSRQFSDAEHPSKYMMAALIRMEDPGLLVYPTHRLLRKEGDFDQAAFLKSLETYFELTPKSKAELEKWVDTWDDQMTFGLYFPDGKGYLARARKLEDLKPFQPQGKSRVWLGLDVSIVTYALISGILKIDEKDWHDRFERVHAAGEFFKHMDSREFSVGIMLRGIPVNVIFAVCEQKDLMPHKSTYFYPKLASGILFYPHKTLTAQTAGKGD